MLTISYGFQCRCSACAFLHKIGYDKVGQHRGKVDDLHLLKQLREFVGVTVPLKAGWSLPDMNLELTPPSLYPTLEEAFLEQLSELFSKASHEGDYEAARESGASLLALYLLIYPPNYPQIGEIAYFSSKSLIADCSPCRSPSTRIGENHLEHSRFCEQPYSGSGRRLQTAGPTTIGVGTSGPNGLWTRG